MYIRESYRGPGDIDHHSSWRVPLWWMKSLVWFRFALNLIALPVQRRMAPLQVALADTTLKNQIDKDEAEFQGHVDSSWRVISVPHGGVSYFPPGRSESPFEVLPGYLLGHILRAATQFQSATSHKEPLYLASQFLGSSTVDPYTVHLKRIKTGHAMSNLLADFRQNVGSPSAGARIDD